MGGVWKKEEVLIQKGSCVNFAQFQFCKMKIKCIKIVTNFIKHTSVLIDFYEAAFFCLISFNLIYE
jgi:hypothetical protein